MWTGEIVWTPLKLQPPRSVEGSSEKRGPDLNFQRGQMDGRGRRGGRERLRVSCGG